MTAPTCRTSAEAEAHEAVAVTDVPAGCLCLAHDQPCHRKRRRNRQLCSPCIELCDPATSMENEDAPACRASPIP